jgi:anthranilate synthase component I
MSSYWPSLSEVLALARRGEGNLCPVMREVPADLETPVSAYLKVARGPYSFLLESVEGGERLARYSFIGAEPYRVVRQGPYAHPWDGADPLRDVEGELSRFQLVLPSGGREPALPRFTGGAVGYLAWECVRHFEPRVPIRAEDPLGVPESLFMFVDTLVVFDHLQHVVKVISHCRLDGDVEASYRQACWRIEQMVARLSRPLPTVPYPVRRPVQVPATVRSNVSKEEFLAMVERARRYVIAGDVIQVVLAQRLYRPLQAHPFSVYRALRAINPSPYMYYLHLDDFQIVGASPEMLVRVEDGEVTTHPIAGTRRRGRTAEEDRALEEELRQDEKERAEHLMLVDLARNDIGRVAEPGTVRVPAFMEVERYSHVMHLVSRVEGRLRPHLTCYDALRACFPAGTVSGAPKVRAMEIIAELENERRGPYAGAVGYFDYSGNMDMAITIRTLVIRGDVAHIYVGAGIVYDSVPEREHAETMAKAAALLLAMERAEEMEAATVTGSLGY